MYVNPDLEGLTDILRIQENRDMQNLFKDEANAYFERNVRKNEKRLYSAPWRMIADFYSRYTDKFQIRNILEIGCNYGYNLMWFKSQFPVECYGVEPSGMAVSYGRKIIIEKNLEGVELIETFSYDLPFEDNKFDVIVFGCCLYITEREKVLRTISEVDRILKNGGFCIIYDFETPVLCRRINKHNAMTYTYKQDYAKLLLPFGYTLIEKRSFTADGDIFNSQIQERQSIQILYKERYEDIYFDSDIS